MSRPCDVRAPDERPVGGCFEPRDLGDAWHTRLAGGCRNKGQAAAQRRPGCACSHATAFSCCLILCSLSASYQDNVQLLLFSKPSRQPPLQELKGRGDTSDFDKAW